MEIQSKIKSGFIVNGIPFVKVNLLGIGGSVVKTVEMPLLDLAQIIKKPTAAGATVSLKE